MGTIDIPVRRTSVVSSKPFDEVVRTLTATIGRPDLNAFASPIVATSAVAVSLPMPGIAVIA